MLAEIKHRKSQGYADKGGAACLYIAMLKKPLRVRSHAGTIFALAAVGPVYNQVVEFNPINPKEITGDLAKSWDVTDQGGTYTFHLYDNVKWWDGKDLTAEDVAFSLQRMIEPGKPRPRTG